MPDLEDLELGFEIHSAEKIRNYFAGGVDANAKINGKHPIEHLAASYNRSDQFTACMKVLVDAGADLGDATLQSVLLDDPLALEASLEDQPDAVHAHYTLGSANTPLEDVTLLHVCAEFNLVKSATVLIQLGADVNAPAGTDENGLGGQTAIFHCVNSLFNHSRPMLEFLLEYDASVDVTVKGLLWGKDQDWETYIPEVDPISFAMIGNLPQFGKARDAADLQSNIELMQTKKYGKPVRSLNIPNQYLVDRRQRQKEEAAKIFDW